MLRSEVENKYKWKLEHIFASDEAWEDEFKQLEKLMESADSLKEGFLDSAKNMLNVFKKTDEMSYMAERLYVYARMRRDEDNSVSVYQAMADRAMGINVKLSSAFAFISPMILEAEEKTILSYLEEEPDLQEYSFIVKDILRRKKHILSEKEERLLSMSADFASGSKDIFTMLNNADLDFGEIDGKPLTHGSYIIFMQSLDRNLRKRAYEQLYSQYKKYINTISATYSTNVKKGVFYAKAKNYGSVIEKALFGDNVPVSLYDNLLKTINDNIGIMHRYVSLKKKILGLDKMYMYDIYAPLVKDMDKEYSYEEAVDMVIKALAPMGEDYIEILKGGFEGGWVDVCETKGKTSGAYSWGAYGTHPYVLLNHRGDLDSVFTIAHEMGHAMHTYYSNEAQPYSTSGYTIFVAEVASTVNELLLTNYLLKNTSGELKKYVLNHYLDQFRTTVVRQAMFAQFERETHKMAEEGKPLTPASLCEVYGKLNADYHGKDMERDDTIKYEWARIPHFYNAFYVYKYATGFSCAVQISRHIIETGDASAYKQFLKTGGSDYPLNELKIAGVDLAGGEPVRACMKAFEEALNEFEKLF